MGHRTSSIGLDGSATAPRELVFAIIVIGSYLLPLTVNLHKDVLYS